VTRRLPAAWFQPGHRIVPPHRSAYVWRHPSLGWTFLPAPVRRAWLKKALGVVLLVACLLAAALTFAPLSQFASASGPSLALLVLMGLSVGVVAPVMGQWQAHTDEMLARDPDAFLRHAQRWVAAGSARQMERLLPRAGASSAGLLHPGCSSGSPVSALHWGMTARLLAPGLPLEPSLRRELPSLSEAAEGLLDGTQQPTPRLMAELAAKYMLDVCRTHYHVGLVRLVERREDIAGIRLKGLGLEDVRLTRYTEEVLPHPDLAPGEARKAVRRVEKELATLRGELPADRISSEAILGFGPLAADETFVLTRATAAAYLARLRQPEGLGDWLSAECLGRTWNRDLPQVNEGETASRSRPRI